MKNDRFWRRLFEIIPGLLTWVTLGSLFVGAFLKPLWVAIFVITFDLYWVIRMGYLTTLLVFAYRRLEREKKIDWIAALRALKPVDGLGFDTVYHAVLFPVYKEGLDILTPSLAALQGVNYPRERMIVVFSVEERAGEKVWQDVCGLKDRHGGAFFRCIATRHPDGLPGEVKVKGANATWGARILKEHIDAEGIAPDRVIISCFDADTVVEREYFGCLTYHYLTNPRRNQSSYQPVPVYNNNIWHARSIARILELGSSFMQMIETQRLEKFVTFSSHSMSFRTLVDVGYWPCDMISDDSVIYWKCFLHFNGDYTVIPMYVTVSMDVATERGVFATIVKQYRQKRRWAWGVENFAYLMMGFRRPECRIRLRTKIRRAFHILESHYTWAIWAVIISFIAPLPLIFGGGLFRQTAIGYNLPSVSAALFRISLFTLFVCMLISIRLLPPRPPDVKRVKFLNMVVQWLVAPVFAALLGSTPAIDAQTRLMFGRYMQFYVTSKSRQGSAQSSRSAA